MTEFSQFFSKFAAFGGSWVSPHHPHHVGYELPPDERMLDEFQAAVDQPIKNIVVDLGRDDFLESAPLALGLQHSVPLLIIEIKKGVSLIGLSDELAVGFADEKSSIQYDLTCRRPVFHRPHSWPLNVLRKIDVRWAPRPEVDQRHRNLRSHAESVIRAVDKAAVVTLKADAPGTRETRDRLNTVISTIFLRHYVETYAPGSNLGLWEPLMALHEVRLPEFKAAPGLVDLVAKELRECLTSSPHGATSGAAKVPEREKIEALTTERILEAIASQAQRVREKVTDDRTLLRGGTLHREVQQQIFETLPLSPIDATPFLQGLGNQLQRFIRGGGEIEGEWGKLVPRDSNIEFKLAPDEVPISVEWERPLRIASGQ